MTAPVYNRDKLKRLIHYVAYRCIDEPKILDAVKLNKVLWFSDLDAYVTSGKPITGAAYIKKPLGPVASDLMPLVEELDRDGDMAIRQLDNDTPREYLALTTPDVSVFTPDEMRIIQDAVQTVVHEHTSRSISDKSHDIVWRLTEMDEEIPYYAVLAGRMDEVRTEDIAWARRELAEMGIEA